MDIYKKSFKSIENQVAALTTDLVCFSQKQCRDSLIQWLFAVDGSNYDVSQTDVKTHIYYQEYLYALRKFRYLLKAHGSLIEDEVMLLVTGIPLRQNVFGKTLVSGRLSYLSPVTTHTQPFTQPLHYLIQAPSFSSVRLMVEGEKNYKEINLPPIFAKRLQAYIYAYCEGEVEDCRHFQQHMLGVDSTTYNEIYRDEKIVDACEELSVGDSIVLTNKSGEDLHAAVYLGEDLFISKLGESILSISSLESLHALYETCNVIQKKLFRETKAYEDMKQETERILETHLDRERLKKVFEDVRTNGIS